MNHAYAAGLFDADGCVSIVKTKRGHTFRHVMRTEVSMCHRPVIEALCKKYGGSVHHRPLKTLVRPENATGIRDIYMWSTGATIAADFLRAILPHLIVKRQEARIAIRFQDSMKHTNGFALSTKEMARRDRLAAACSALKRKRYNHSI